MKKNIEDYIINLKNFLGKELCQSAVSSLQSAEFAIHTYADSKTLITHSTTTDLSISYDEIPEYQTLMQLTWNGIFEYYKQINCKWHTGWSGYGHIRFNKYTVGTEMQTHCDHIHTLFDGSRKGIPILTVLGCLNEEYKGGDLIMCEDTKIDFHAGDLLIFPSNFLYPHSVSPITEGVRYSFVTWVW